MHLWCSRDPIISHPVLFSRTGPPGFSVVSPIVRWRCNIPITSPIQWLVNPHVTHVTPFNFHGVLKSNLRCSHVAAQLTPASPSKSRAMKSSCAISWRGFCCSLPVGLRDPNTFWRTFEALRILHDSSPLSVWVKNGENETSPLGIRRGNDPDSTGAVLYRQNYFYNNPGLGR